MLADTRDHACEACRAPQSFNEPAVQARLVGALSDATGAALIETHISYVLLTGTLAYKIKKAVSLGFLDFRTLSARRFFCEEELRLNRRLAPELYLDVVPITGSPDAPSLGGAGQPIEYAVRMREFEQHALATRALARGEFTTRHVDALATRIAAFHRAADAAPADGALGMPSTILRLALDNFAQLRPLLRTPAELQDVDVVEGWTRDHHAACSQSMSRRLREGFIRECHGDLHLGNIAVVDREPLVFDCIEFNPEMRWIDVMNEIAFTTMDLEDRGRTDLAYRFLNAYLAITGDYEGLGVLRFYLVYRAMVRAKVARLRATQIAAADAASVLGIEYSNYVGRAKALMRPRRPALVLMHGCAGSGKTTVSQQLLESAGAVRIRSDVERKRLHGVASGARHGGGIETGLYTAEATRATYERTLAQARSATAAGYPTIVDAAFLKAWQRRLFAELAAELRIPFVIITLADTPDVLRERIMHRLQGANDASDADLDVLEHQLRTQEPLTAEERAFAIEYRSGTSLAQPQSRQRWNEILARLAGTGNVPRQWVTRRPCASAPDSA